MEKTIASPAADAASSPSGSLDLARLARVQLNSEDPAHPIEAALEQPTRAPGWRASAPGPQTLTLSFKAPQDIRQVYVCFECNEARTHEFSLTYSLDRGATTHSIVRQQYTFSPGGSTRETETYPVNLSGVTDLTLTIIPNISGGEARASLRELRLS